jgi:tetratricopeptide (TPR) repeat protein
MNEAAFHLERARRLAGTEDPEMLYHLGVVYSRLGRYNDAESALKSARRLDPGWEPIRKELRRLGRILSPPALATTADMPRHHLP